MKADPSVQAELLQLQGLDTTLAQLAHRRKTLPELAQIAEVSERIVALDRRRVAAETKLSDAGREVKAAEAEVDRVKQRKNRDEDRLNSGAITNPKDLESLQNELVALNRRISVLEDAQLELMEAYEAVSEEVDAIHGQLTQAKGELEPLESAREAKLAEIDAEERDAAGQRATRVELLPAELVTFYDKVREQQGGLGAAALKGKTCQGCRLEINGADLRELAEEPADAVVRCPECRRILIRGEGASI